jgi:hypothetical protein
MKEIVKKAIELLAHATSGFICVELMLLMQAKVETNPVATNLSLKVNSLLIAFLTSVTVYGIYS